MSIKENKPKISVIMPAYNAEAFVREAIDSVLNQTYDNLELIVIDDCSTDNTFNLISQIGKTDSRIAVYRNEKNQGVAETRNRGFELAQGDYVALLDSDDVWRKEKLEKQLELARQYEPCIVYCSYALMDVAGKSKNKEYIVPEKTNFAHMLEENAIGCSTVMLSKEIVGEYRFIKKYYHEDYVYWLRVLKDGYPAVGLKEVYVDYRVMENSRSGNKLRSALKRWKIYREFLELSFSQAFVSWIKYVFKGIIKYF